VSDLSPVARAVLDDPPEPVSIRVPAAGIRFHGLVWGDPDQAPLLLVHGITSSAEVWWRVGPALGVALDRRVVAVDQAGHGRSEGWAGGIRFQDNASHLAAFVRAAGLGRPDLRIVGHSWGGMTVAAFPAAGLIPEVLVLLDPPVLPMAAILGMLEDPVERHYDEVSTASAALSREHPDWTERDVAAKARALVDFDEPAVRAVLTEDQDWDGGLGALADPVADGVVIRLVRGDEASGGLIPDAVVRRFVERIGAANVETIDGGGHSPMRVRPVETTAALIRALRPA
jgi:pimeloyl-ACP methyl ester carboxylesterase